MQFVSRALRCFALLVFISALEEQSQGQELSFAQTAQNPAGGESNGDYFFYQDNVVQLAELLQQPAMSGVAAATAQPSTSRSTSSSRQSNIRLASVPNMFGDLALATVGTVVIVRKEIPTIPESFAGAAQVPLSAGGRPGKLSENDVALPTDRVFCSYNHFENVFAVSEVPVPPSPPGPVATRQQSIDRYTLGAEKTFSDGWGSVEVRMPFNGNFDVNLQSAGIDGGNVGNLAAVLKALLYQDDSLGIGVGLALEAPTASDISSRFGTASIRFLNQAYHVLPYIGFLYAPGDPTWGWSDGLFFSGFAQLDIVTNGNRVHVVGPGEAVLADLGKFTEQNLLFLDLSMGYWLYRNPDAPGLTGLAAITELHYTTTLQDADFLISPLAMLPAPPSSSVEGAALIGSADRRFDIVNATIGVQALLYEASSLRVAGVFPLGSREDQRFFDAEVQVQFNRRF